MRDSTIQHYIHRIRQLEKEVDHLNKRIEQIEINLNFKTAIPSTTTYSEDAMFNVPTCCKGCPNHPSNGGSGICHCTLPYFENPLTWGVRGVTLDCVNSSDICFDGTTNKYMYDKNSECKCSKNV